MKNDDPPGGERTGDSVLGSALMNHALDVLAVLKDSGVTVTELEPTDAMLRAGMAVAGNSAEQVRTIFRAMLVVGGGSVNRLQ
ncbi:hypothetical protein JL101_006850 [Skermanella rosea]|uniref:hypothetical protein n=1 Tax=Skermanella rosea TaxID=1817965 RepID=UPI001931D3DD|nr:hypothetical protein [Skermanella rosea]UEM05150.1 hypothetical protein JL101_006850 [Skermanella rosea]